MKNILLLFSIITTASYGQNYSVSSFTSSYTDLIGAQTLTTVVWDDPDFIITPGFAIAINGNDYDSLFISDLGCTVTGIKNGIGNRDAVNPSMIDIIDRGYDTGVSQSSISYKVEGLIGNRICKLQWKNVGSYGEYDLGGNSMSINFQLWFYEQGNYIEARYGTSNVTDANVFYESETGAGFTVLDDLYNASPNDVYLTGTTSFPSIISVYGRMSGTPANGQVYRLTPSMSVGVVENVLNTISLYPNPCQDILSFINIDAQNYALYSVEGKLIISEPMLGAKSINVADIPKGNYLLILTNHEGENFHHTFIKQ